MGANFATATLPACDDRTVLRNEINSLLESDRIENGRSYSGGIGMKSQIIVEEKIFDDENSAYNYLTERFPDKWGPGGAVRVKKPMKVDPAEGEEEALKKELQSSWTTPSQVVAKEVIERVKAAKSKTKGCSGCGSSIAVSHIRSVNCPVCNHPYLLIQSDQDKIKRLTEALEKKRARLKELQDKRVAASCKKNGETYYWLIGGWCSS
jgi:hypothetical protein